MTSEAIQILVWISHFVKSHNVVLSMSIDAKYIKFMHMLECVRNSLEQVLPPFDYKYVLLVLWSSIQSVCHISGQCRQYS